MQDRCGLAGRRTVPAHDLTMDPWVQRRELQRGQNVPPMATPGAIARGLTDQMAGGAMAA